VSTSRLEAFSDGVFAIAITLLVLEIDIPSAESSDLWHQLTELWPAFAAYLVSFMVIGIIWVNHHGVIDHLRRTDRGVLYLNLALLLTVGFLPYPTAVLAEHLNTGADEEVAAAFYSGAMTMMGLAFGALWVYITRHRELLGVELTDDEVRTATRRFTLGNPFYALAIGISFVSPAAVLVIIAGLALYYAVAGMRSPAIDEER
jgi:TMEM175 potassium channel family protein